MSGPPPGGLVVVDKPGGWTSHDVVARVRRLAGTRRVGHAGTLDPMATGVLLVGVDRATRLLGHLALTEKEYDGTVALGATTSTDDAQGDLLRTADASGVSEDDVRRAAARQVGALSQVPPAVSAIKVDGVRSYTRVRKGEVVELKPRPVTVHELVVLDVRSAGAQVLVDVHVRCSTGTYIRSLARDIGEELGVGGHLAALRRTRVGSWTVAQSAALDDLSTDGAFAAALIPLADVAAATFARRDVDAEDARRLTNGIRLDPTGGDTGPTAAFGPDGEFLALLEDRDGAAVPLAVFV